MTSIETVRYIVGLLDSKKATDITVLEVGGLSSLCDYFVIASGNSTTQVKTLSEEVEDKLSAQGTEPRRVEGESSAMWILMDYGDVILHLFYHETRDFYCLERLWADAKKLGITALLDKAD